MTKQHFPDEHCDSPIKLLARFDRPPSGASAVIQRLVFLVIVAIALPTAGLIDLDHKLVLGIPLSIVWMAICVTILSILSLVSYRRVYRPWSEHCATQLKRPSEGSTK